MRQRVSVFFVSDHTGITAETLGRSLLARFDHIEFRTHRLPFVDDADKLEAALARIADAARSDGRRPVVISSLTDPALRQRLQSAEALVLDVFASFLPHLEEALGATASDSVGRFHRMDDAYRLRMEAINYTLAHDDGLGDELDRADVILLGVSRCGKTPTCLYLALHYGSFAANHPLTEEDFQHASLPPRLARHRPRLVGLTIAPERLHLIREERRPGSRYAALATCQREIQQAITLYRHENIPYLDSTTLSVEELAASIVARLALAPRV